MSLLTQQFFGTLSIQIGLHPNLNELVYQPGKNLSHFKVIRSFHVNNTRMRIFIANHSTNVKKFFDVGAGAKGLNAINKTSLFFEPFRIFKSPRVINKELQRDSKKGASSARRKAEDALSLLEYFFCILRHFFDRKYSLFKRPNNRFFVPKHRLLTAQTLCNTEIVVPVKMGLIGFLTFNWMDITKCFSPAMRAHV